jgi:hypothetical protein
MATEKEMTAVEQLELEYPLIATEFKKILREQYELFAEKMNQYGLDNISMGTRLETPEEKKLSLTAVYIRCMDKINRLKNLVLLNKKNYLESTESIEDSYKDLVNYNIIAQLVSRDKWVK